MKLWAEERRSHTLELLLTLPVTPTQAIVGKFVASWVFLGLALALTFPVVLTTAYLGEPDLGVVFSGYVGSFLLAGAYLAIGMFTSALTRNQVISFILSVVVGLGLILAGFPPIINFFVHFFPAWMVDAVAACSFVTHFEVFGRGLIDARDLFYFVSLIAFMLFVTHIALRRRA